jgi:hypothetical protein
VTLECADASALLQSGDTPPHSKQTAPFKMTEMGFLDTLKEKDS